MKIKKIGSKEYVEKKTELAGGFKVWVSIIVNTGGWSNVVVERTQSKIKKKAFHLAHNGERFAASSEMDKLVGYHPNAVEILKREFNAS